MKKTNKNTTPQAITKKKHMPLYETIDYREKDIATDQVMAIYEDSWHDHEELYAEEDDSDDDVEYLGIERTTIDDAIEYANRRWRHPVTLYLYDVGENNFSDYATLARDREGILNPAGTPTNIILCDRSLNYTKHCIAINATDA